MRKIILFTLFFITFVNFSSKVFASSKYANNKAYHGALGCFDYLVKTRNNNGKDREIESKRQEMKHALISVFNDRNPIGRDIIMTAYIERTEDYRRGYNQHKKNKDGKEQLSMDCLNEMSKIASIIGLK